jgi:hypothetical protein
MVASAMSLASEASFDAGKRFRAIRFSRPTGSTPMGSLNFSVWNSNKSHLEPIFGFLLKTEKIGDL